MEWTKTKLTRWTCEGFSISETGEPGPRAFRLDVHDEEQPKFFPTHGAAKDHAELLNELALYRADNERLRAENTQVVAELLERRDHDHFEREQLLAEIEEPQRSNRITVPQLAIEPDPWFDAPKDDGRGIPTRAHA